MGTLSGRGRVAAVILVVAVPTIILCAPAPAAAETGDGTSADTAGAWEWPIAAPHQVQRPFEAPPTPYSAGHRGIDLAAPSGRAVLAAADGVVSFSGFVVDRPVLSVRHDGGLVSSIEPVAATVAAGDAVRTGDVIGVVASGGHCDGRCVHLGARLYGEYVNPMALLGLLPNAVLLPLGR
ncbi:peptidoglycan DD-metalloendopeptidase family protein [Mycetocola sp. 2940]|uniref:M23 family metallopeptidase n=1 Tax=Mycetocola sp. 2940 TaxID=3156452 RepID=UPI003397524A